MPVHELDKTNLFGSSKEYTQRMAQVCAGASWQLHKEDFFNAAAISSLVRRATYGINGNVAKHQSISHCQCSNRSARQINLMLMWRNPANRFCCAGRKQPSLISASTSVCSKAVFADRWSITTGSVMICWAMQRSMALTDSTALISTMQVSATVAWTSGCQAPFSTGS